MFFAGLFFFFAIVHDTRTHCPSSVHAPPRATESFAVPVLFAVVVVVVVVVLLPVAVPPPDALAVVAVESAVVAFVAVVVVGQFGVLGVFAQSDSVGHVGSGLGGLLASAVVP